LKEQPLLQVALSPLRISLKLPHGLPTPVSFEIKENVQTGEDIASNPDVRIVTSENNVSIFWKDLLLVSATLLDQGTVHLKLDLRPIGIAIYDDPEGLHIGANLMAHSSFVGCMTAISLS
jgi:hypothetical protein